MGEYVVNRPDEGAMEAARAALVRAGLDDLTLRDLRADCELRAGGEGALLAHARERDWITRNEAMELLGIGAGQCRPLLRRLLESGEIVQQRQRYQLNDKNPGE